MTTIEPTRPTEWTVTSPTEPDTFIRVREMKGADVAPDATPVLAIHSGGLTSRQWRRLAEALAPTRPVILPDLIGYGKSSRWPDGKPFSFRTDLAMVRALVDQIGRPVHIVGHSYGGLLGLLLAVDDKTVARSLSIFEPVTFGFVDETIDADGELARMRTISAAEGEGGKVSDTWLESFVDWWNGSGAWKGMNDETKNAFREVSWKLINEVRSLSADTTSLASYASITAPRALPHRRDDARHRATGRRGARQGAPARVTRALRQGRTHGADHARRPGQRGHRPSPRGARRSLAAC